MDFSMDAVANKMVMIISGLTAAIAVGGFAFYQFTANPLGAIPFAIGAAMGGGVNVVKILWLKRTVSKAITLNAASATNHLRAQYLLRLILTMAVLLIGGFLHGTYVNLIGVAIALLVTMPIASYSMQFFIPKDEHIEAIAVAASTTSSPTQDAIDEINKLAAKEAE